MSTTLTKTEISSLYVAIFNRASEGKGNQFWQSINRSMADTATEMLKAGDALTYFGSSLDSNQAFIEHIYKNTLNKTIDDDAEGIDFWVTLLETGKSRGEVIEGLIKAATTSDFTGNQTALDAQAQFNNRVEVSNHMADTVFETPDNYAQVTGFGADLTVTADSATVTAANTKIDDLTEVAGETIVISNGGEIQGSDNNDLFIATRGDIDNAVIQAKDGTDTLKATISNATDDNAAVTSFGLEKILLRNTDGTTTIDLLEADGLEEVWNDRGSDGTTLILDKVSTDVKVGIKSTSSVTTVNYESVSGADDSVDVILDGAEEGASLVASGVETLNLDVTSSSYLDVSGNAGLKAVNITSDTETTLKVDGASTMTISGGEGEDTLLLSGSLGSNLTLSSIENLAVSDTSTIDMDDVEINKLISLKGDLTVSNVEDELFMITTDDDADVAATPTADSASLTATLKDATGTADSISVEVLNKDTNAPINASLTLNDIEVLNIETNADSGAENSVKINLTTSTTSSATQTLNISGDAVAKFETTAIEAETIDASSNTAGVELLLGGAIQHVTGTAQSDVFDFGVNGTKDDIVDGGAGDDVIKFTTDGTDVSATTSNIEVAEVTFADATHTFDADNLADVSTIKVSGTDGTLSNILTDTDIEIADDQSMTLSLKDSTGTSDSLNIVLTKDGSQTTTITANDIETLKLSTTDAGTTTIDTLTADSLSNLDLSALDGGVTITNAFTNTTAMNLKLGNGDISFSLKDNDVKDTISFGNTIGDVSITNFSTDPGATGDSLDLSIFGVESIDELTITDTDDSSTTGNIEITLAGNTDFGTITLIGVTDTAELTSDDFTFA